MNAHVLLNLFNEFGKEIKCEACRAFYLFFATSLMNPVTQEHECKDSIYHMTIKIAFICDVTTSSFCHYVSTVAIDVITFTENL